MEALVKEWRKTLTERERALHHLAAIKLKKNLNATAEDGDQGSYFPEYSHAFRKWLKTKETVAK